MKDIEYKIILEELLKLLDEGVYIVDENGIGLFYNDAMAKIEEIHVDDVIGKEYHKAFPGVNIDESTMFKALKKGISTENNQQTYKNLYGREVTTVNRTVPIVDKGKIVGALEVARDITSLRNMSDTILELREKETLKEKKSKKRSGIREYSFSDIKGEAPNFIQAVDRAKKAANNNASVFIYGETGTGKELFAQSIHRASLRKDRPFLAQNCAALPQTLLEGILFGTAKGGFTGAVDRAGLFEQADGGTLLLDEISAMPYELQSKLLRALQEKYIRRVGGTKDISVDTRIIATVNEDPQKLMAEGKLRKDLYYRLSVVNITIPPLRERKEDIPLLANHFVSESNEEYGKEIWIIDDKAINRLSKYNYPGNVRELENIIIQSVALSDMEHALTDRMLQMPDEHEFMSIIERRERTTSLPEYMEALEKEMIRETLLDQGGNISKSAESLGIKRQTLQHKMKKYGFKMDL